MRLSSPSFHSLLLPRRSAIATALCAILSPTAPAHAFEAFRVRFYSEVSRESCLQLRSAVEERVSERAQWSALARTPLELETLPPIDLHVSSSGGSLFDALHLYDYLSTVPVLHTHAEGIVASAATLLTVVGAHRTMTKHSMMLVHQPSLPVGDSHWKMTDMRDEWKNMLTSTAALVDVYNATTLLDIDDIMSLLQNEEYLTARDCLKYGFIDEIL